MATTWVGRTVAAALALGNRIEADHIVAWADRTVAAEIKDKQKAVALKSRIVANQIVVLVERTVAVASAARIVVTKLADHTFQAVVDVSFAA